MTRYRVTQAGLEHLIFLETSASQVCVTLPDLVWVFMSLHSFFSIPKSFYFELVYGFLVPVPLISSFLFPKYIFIEKILLLKSVLNNYFLDLKFFFLRFMSQYYLGWPRTPWFYILLPLPLELVLQAFTNLPVSFCSIVILHL